MDGDGGHVTVLVADPAEDRSPALSRDGRQVAFTSTRDGNAEIYVINVDGTGLQRVTNDPHEDDQPAWSPDGSLIAFARQAQTSDDGGIFTVRPDGTDLTPLSRPGGAGDRGPAWSPDGSTLAFTRGPSDLMTMKQDGTGVTPL